MADRRSSVVFLGNDAQLNATLARIETKLKALSDTATVENEKMAVSSEAAASRFGAAFDHGTSRAGGALSKLSGQMASFGVPFSGSIEKIGKQLDDATTKTGKLSAAMAGLGKATAVGGLAAFAAAAYEGVKGATKLQTAMEQIHTQAGASQAEVDRMTKSVISLAGSLATSPTQLADSLYHVESAGFRGQKALDIMSVAAKEAKISGANLTDTTTALTAAVFSGIKGAQNFTQAMGLLNATVGAGDMKFQDLNEAFAGPMLATVKGYGLSLKDVGAALATFGDLNIRGADAATELRMAVQYMAKPAATAGPLLKEMGLNVHSFADAMANGGLLPALQLLHDRMDKLGIQGNQMAQVIGDLFTKKGSAGVTILENSLSKLQGKYGAVGAGVNAQSAAWDAWNKTLAAQMDHLKATVQALADKFGMYLIPKLEAAGQAINSVIGWMQKHKTVAEALAVTIAGVLGTALAAYAYTKAVAFVSATKAMVSGIGSLVSGIASAVPTILTKLGLIGSGSAATATEVETQNVAAGASFTALATEAGAAEVEALAAMGSLAEGVATADAAIETSNVAAGASFTAMLGPIGAVAAAIGGLTYLGITSPSAPGRVPGTNVAPGTKFGAEYGAGSLPVGPGGSGIPSGYGGNAISGFFNANQNMNLGLPSGYGGGAIGAFQGASSNSFTPTTFAIATLQSLGIKPTPQNIRDFTAWEQQEGGNWNNSAKYNPLNTTMGEPGAGNTGSQGNIKVYTSWGQGLKATVDTLKNYPGILDALKSGASQSQFSAAVAASPWGTGAVNAQGKQLSQAQLDALLNSTGNGTKTSTSKAIKTLLYANPLGGDTYNVERTDQGKDFGDIVGTIKAIGAGQIVLAQTLSGFGQTVVERLTSGPNKGQEVYYGFETGATGVGIRQGQSVGAGQVIGRGRGTGGVEFGFWNPATGRPEGAPYYTHEGVATPQGTAFANWLKSIGSGMYTTTSGGITTGGGSNVGYTIAQAVQQFVQALQKATTSLIQTYQSLEQSGTVKTLTKGLGVATGGGVAQALQVKIEGLDPAQVQKALTLGQDPHQLDQTLVPILEKAAANSQASKNFNTLVAELRGAGQTGQANALVSARGGAFSTLAQEMYAQQVLKDAESLQLQATQEKDRTTIAANEAAAVQQIMKDTAQLQADRLTQMATAIKDTTQTITDRFQMMVTAITDETARMADASNAVVQGIQDQTQIRVDILGERGLYGLNLIAQREQVQLDIMKAGFDQQIAVAQANLDQVKATENQIVGQKQLQVDQITAAQDQIVAMAQQRADTAQLHADNLVSKAQSHADAVTLAQDIAVSLAQTAVDLSANAPKAQQDAANAQLKKATASASLAEATATQGLTDAQGQATGIVNRAQSALTEAQGKAAVAEGNAQQALTTAQGQANTAIAQATQALTGVQDTAAQAEAGLQGVIDITKQTAATQFAGTGTVVNIYGIPAENAAAVGDALDWVARTQLGALS